MTADLTLDVMLAATNASRRRGEPCHIVKSPWSRLVPSEKKINPVSSAERWTIMER
jgi:hypothetical protein